MNRVSATTEQMLSKSEQRVARLLAWGYTKKEIADRLFLSPHTISAHLRTIYSKIAAHKETDLCRWWIFNEYGIADNPMKKVIAVFFLVLSVASIIYDNNMVRVFRNAPMRQAARAAKPVRARRYENAFELHLALTA